MTVAEKHLVDQRIDPSVNAAERDAQGERHQGTNQRALNVTERRDVVAENELEQAEGRDDEARDDSEYERAVDDKPNVEQTMTQDGVGRP